MFDLNINLTRDHRDKGFNHPSKSGESNSTLFEQIVWDDKEWKFAFGSALAFGTARVMYEKIFFHYFSALLLQLEHWKSFQEVKIIC